MTSARNNADLGAWPQQTDGLAGVAAGDAICRKLASDAKLPAADSFLAYLSDSISIDARDRFAIDGPWRRLDHYLIAADVAELTSGRLTVPISVDENGFARSFHTWTGTASDGLGTDFTCGDWQSTSGQGTWGWATFAGPHWVRYLDNLDCSATHGALYCLGDRVVLFWNDFEGAAYTPEWSDSVGLVH